MDESTRLECPCPLRGLVDVAGKSWGVCVVSALGRHGKLRYGALSRCLRLSSPTTLVSTLRSLEATGLVERYETPTPGPPEVSYDLTPKGFSLFQSLLNMEYWFGR
jgi:DNA-binding HxlR family transcriptional regulator